jgi:hypothetical protein
MTSRVQELAQRRRDLQMRSEMQRREILEFFDVIEAKLGAADDMLAKVTRVVKNPLVIMGAAAGVMLLRPWRMFRWAGPATLILDIARRVRSLVAR